jgi:hypothetical protein
MKKELRKKQPKSRPGKWDVTPAPGWADKKTRVIWDWFLEGNDIPKREFLKELSRNNNPRNALDRLFAKMNTATMRQKKTSPRKGGPHSLK